MNHQKQSQGVSSICGRMSTAELKHLQRINRGVTSEKNLPQVNVIGRLIEKGLVTGVIRGGTIIGYGGWAEADGLAITPEGQAALAAALNEAGLEMVRYQKAIMQAVIDAAGAPVPEHELPGYNTKTFKLRGKYRRAFDELRGFGSDIDALAIQRDSQGVRMVSPGPEFERIKKSLGL